MPEPLDFPPPVSFTRAIIVLNQNWGTKKEDSHGHPADGMLTEAFDRQDRACIPGILLVGVLDLRCVATVAPLVHLPPGLRDIFSAPGPLLGP